MKRARKFLGLPLTDKLLLLRALCLLGVITLALRVVPFQTLLRGLRGFSDRHRNMSRNGPSAERIAWATRAMSRYVPKAVCLPQALTAEYLCRRAGCPATLRIGVTRDPAGKLQAHAWVESQDSIIIGGLANLNSYVPMPPLESKGA